MTKKMNRRELIQKTLAGFGALSLPISLTACGDDADSNTQPNTQVQFLHGVASGDPLQTQVIIWTRVTPSDSSARLEVQWEVAKDVDFKHITATGKVLTTAAQDFTVKVDVTGLAAGQVYFYRFKSAKFISTVLNRRRSIQSLGKPKPWQRKYSRYSLQYAHVQISQRAISMFIKKWQNRMWML